MHGQPTGAGSRVASAVVEQPALVAQAVQLERTLDELMALVQQAEGAADRLKAEPTPGAGGSDGTAPTPVMSLENRLNRLQQYAAHLHQRLAAVVVRFDRAI